MRRLLITVTAAGLAYWLGTGVASAIDTNCYTFQEGGFGCPSCSENAEECGNCSANQCASNSYKKCNRERDTTQVDPPAGNKMVDVIKPCYQANRCTVPDPCSGYPCQRSDEYVGPESGETFTTPWPGKSCQPIPGGGG